MMRTSTWIGSTPPTRRNSRSWITRSSLAWVSGEMVPTSSRKRVPSSAASNRPRRLATAPVKAPLTCPKRVDSSSSDGMALVCTGTKGPSARGLRRWMARATSSFPVPDSPTMRMLERAGAARFTSSKTSRMRGLRPTISPSPSSWRRRRTFSSSRRRFSRAWRMTCSTSSFLNGLGM